MNQPMTKTTIMELVDDMIRGTDYEKRFLEYCKVRKIVKGAEGGIVGKPWYRNFMKRQEEELVRGKVRIQDHQRSSWCTYEHFKNMYDTIYEAMVECGVAEKLNDEVMYDIDGIETDDENKMFGRRTKYKMLKPERCLFVDETGCNTNQVDEGNVEGEKFVFPKHLPKPGRCGATTNLHFTVMPFIAGTGEAVMCAVILKSEYSSDEIPLQWRLGINMKKEPGE
jgi:hypothetical protein